MIILALFFFGLALYGIISWANKTPDQKSNNPYIQKHNKKLQNDAQYNNYLRWCQKNGEIPMNKEIFIKEVEDKENQINNLFR